MSEAERVEQVDRFWWCYGSPVFHADRGCRFLDDVGQGNPVLLEHPWLPGWPLQACSRCAQDCPTWLVSPRMAADMHIAYPAREVVTADA